VLLGNPGFRTDHLLMMSFDPTLVHSTPGETREFFRTLVERARQLPGARNAALSYMVPFEEATVGSDKIVPEGMEFPPEKDGDSVLYNTVDNGYFETMGVPIVRGRIFRTTDTAISPRVAVINQAMAERYWPNRDAIGRRFRLGGRSGQWVQVVGLAQTAVYTFMGEPRTPFFYMPLEQNPKPRMTLMVETEGDAAALTEPLRNLVRSIDAHQPVYNVRTMREYYQVRGLQFLRMIVNLVGTMGLLGLTMALIGLYGLVTYSVSGRTREIGIRMAIGAAQSEILRLVLRHGLTLTLIGLGLGLAGSFGLLRSIRALFSRLQDTGMFDPWTFIVVPVALFVVTMLASYIPARRAAAIDPNQALHYE
jgi:predicted permease